MKSTYDVVAIVVVRRFEADNKCWPSLKKMALQTDLSNLRLHPALITPLRSNNPRAQIWDEERRARGHDLRIWRNRHEPGKVRLFAAAPSESVRHLQADE
jgi:hypothetical protein